VKKYIAEGLGTFCLVFAGTGAIIANDLHKGVAPHVSGAREKGIMAGAAIGGVVAFEALFAGPVCGASMNPARSLGPAAVSGSLNDLWIYLTAPVLGAALAVVGCRCIQDDGCC